MPIVNCPAGCYLLAVALFASGLSIATLAEADVFRFVAEDGTPHFSDQPSDPRHRLFLHTGGEARTALAGEPFRRNLRSLHKLHEARRLLKGEISAAAQASRLDPALLHAVVEVESGYNPKAVSPKGALGLMQLMPDTARRYGVTDPFDAAQNLRGGAHHLRNLLNRFSNDKELALAAYNAGEAAVLRHGRIPPYRETRDYVPAVLQRYELLRSNAQTIGN